MKRTGKPKILIISSRADFGGGPEHIYRLIQALKNEINFFVACPDDYPYWNRYASLIGNGRMVKIPHRKFKANAVSSLIRFLHKNQIHQIHSHGKGAGIYSRTLTLFTGIPCIHTFHGIHIGEYNNFQKSTYILLERIMSKFTKTFIAVSKSEFELVKKLKIVRTNKINIINNGVIIPFKRVDEKVLERKKFKIITFSRFDYSKNTLLLIDILNALKKLGKIDLFETTILGSGEDEQIFKQKLEQTNLSSQVKVLGFVENTADYLLDAFCYISTSRWEGLPLGILEAMAYGVPAIATNVTGNKDIVENNINGFLYAIDKPEEAAGFIIQLSNNKNLWRTFSNASSSKIKEDFSVDKMAKKTKQLYMRNLRV